ncbi:hypothetical protein BAUCODRAFT_74344 [Baudoinia panamericana UAMH 10762]|uniref:Membrane insertase YidC/Oxa/ALB C-terminal domain-containing protein n=1 Tax=Baudoinia panamericana (strain UAMH 10762) TaxID=717646 RepID=M2MR43_BAUPA|nr:uncharacterized protein BAUCODRAFT_74344 [Baudoinia panamericana UAMH 10762]EMC93933.1 hypothetical protein BAUCODRAFT_74344 [Baudoinia panamericana UAMH 10762]
MPSRGLRIAGSNAPRLLQFQCRSLSSATGLNRIRTTPRPIPSLSPPSRWQGTSLRLIAAMRHASTVPTASPAQPVAANHIPSSELLSPSDPSHITIDGIDLGQAFIMPDIPEKIGYLQEVGISFWYGPTSVIEWILEHIHIYSGMPWWGSIAATAVLLRLVMVPFFVRSADSQARQAALITVTKPITAAITQAQRDRDQESMMMHVQRLRQIQAENGISYSAMFVPMVMQAVLGYCGFKLVRAMANLPVPGLRDGGFLWLKDLTVADPYGILPLAMGAAIHLVIRMGGETGASNPAATPPGMRAFMLYGMPGIIILVTAWLPGALCVWFSASGAVGLGQALLFQQPAVRRWLGIAPLYKPQTEEERRSTGFAGLFRDLVPGSGNERGRQALRPSTLDNQAGKNSAYMSPQWQAPNLQTRPTSGGAQGKIVDIVAKSSATPASSEDEDKGFKALFKAPGTIWKGLKSNLPKPSQASLDRSVERAAQRERDAKKRAAAEYEERAQKRQRQR